MPIDKNNSNEREIRLDSCPHCGQKLSPWQQVLLSVDRVLMCKNCWYRIILDFKPSKEESTKPEDKKKQE